MKETTIEFEHYNLHIIPTKRFKQVKVRVVFHDEIKKDEITIRNFLGDMLTYSSKTYNTSRDLSIIMQELYSIDAYHNTFRIGNIITSNFFLTFLNPKYTEKNMYENSIKFLSELLFNPNIKDNQFDRDSFKIIKKFTKEEIEGQKENTKSYSIIRMLENMSTSPISYRTTGYLDDLNRITPKNLYEYYKKFMLENNIDVFVLGDIDIDETKKLFKKHFPFKTRKRKIINPYIEAPKNINYQTIIEKEKVKQSKLSIGCYTKDLTSYEMKYPITLFNIILGSGTDSKFFKDIREKESLAYYIYSTCNKADNTIIISSGINYKDFNKTVDLIKQKLDEMKQGEFSEKDITKAKKLFQTSIEEIVDRQYTLIDMYFIMTILDIDKMKTRINKMNKVTKEEIVKVANKVHIDTIYMLGGNYEKD